VNVPERLAEPRGRVAPAVGVFEQQRVEQRPAAPSSAARIVLERVGERRLVSRAVVAATAVTKTAIKRYNKTATKRPSNGSKTFTKW
jgi:hypothetical protein